MSQDILLTVMNSTAFFDDYVNVEMQNREFCVKCLDLDTELLNKQNAYNDLSKSYSQLKKHCISFELTMQLNQEFFQNDTTSDNQNALEILEYFENNDLKAQLLAKDTTICKLKENIKSIRKNNKEENVKQEMDEIETINIELEHNVAKLLSENELLHKEIKHLKKIYKDQFDSIKKTHALSKEQCDSLVAQLNPKKLKGKNVLDNATTITNATNFAPGMFKLDLDPLAPRLLKNKDAHIDYLKYTQEQEDILRGIVEQVKAKQPLDNALDFACSRDTNLYTVSLDDMLKTSLICLLLKASKTKSWLWHRQLSHLNFGTLNKLAKDGLVRDIPKLKLKKDHLCSICVLGKNKKSSHQPKVKDTNQEKLYLLHMDLCGSMLVESINRKKYILVIVDDHSRFTWVKFLRSKDEASESIIKCIKNIQVCLNDTVRNARTDNGTDLLIRLFENFIKMSASRVKHLLLALLNRTTLSKDITGI
uniref:Ribonuclease H-like domain-containing protein n=1 Tax=Tanacetum cinerariifolium TaxID=118510 RepID=A0A699J6D7_TANCI|nr:ribonuclease H-like domain-containing protein [Tanacetum cinerariifolium]